MQTVDLSRISDADRIAAEQIARSTGVDLKDCYQCGKCSAGCPMAEAMDMPPQRVIRNLQIGLIETVLDAQGPWICAGCDVCACRCPQDVDISGLMRAVRLASKAAGKQPFRDSDVFEEVFMQKVYKWGRNNEQFLAASYNMVSGHLFQDVVNVPKMLSRHLVGVKVHSVRDVDAVRELIDRCLDRKKGGADDE